MKQLRTLGSHGNYFECPRWHEGAWWVSDFYAHRVCVLTDDGTTLDTLDFDFQPAGLGWLPDGSCLVVAMQERKVIRYAGGAVSEYADLGALCPGWANDMIVDSSGIAYVGNFGFDLQDPLATTVPTGLVMISADRKASVVADDLYFPNGLAFSLDGSELIVNETLAGRHSAFTVEPDGTLSRRRLWAQPAPPPQDLAHPLETLQYAPDGGSLDADGRLWVADALNHRVVLVAEGGAIHEVIEMPDDLQAFACSLGGPEGTSLLITASPDFDAVNRSAVTESVLLATTVTTPRADTAPR